jgi:hypothetical protein
MIRERIRQMSDADFMGALRDNGLKQLSYSKCDGASTKRGITPVRRSFHLAGERASGGMVMAPGMIGAVAASYAADHFGYHGAAAMIREQQLSPRQIARLFACSALPMRSTNSPRNRPNRRAASTRDKPRVAHSEERGLWLKAKRSPDAGVRNTTARGYAGYSVLAGVN